MCVDAEGPYLEPLEPSPNAAVRELPVIRAIVWDQAGIASSSVRVLLDGVDVTGAPGTSFDGSVLTAAPEALAEGPHVVTIQAEDEVGNAGTTTWSFVYDRTAPGAELVAPVAGGTAASNRPTVQIRLADGALGAGIDPNSVSFYLDGWRSGWVLEGDLLSFTPTEDLIPGTHLVLIAALDPAGNRGQAAWTFDVVADAGSGSGPTLTVAAPLEEGCVRTWVPAFDIALTAGAAALDRSSLRVSLASLWGWPQEISGQAVDTPTGVRIALTSAQALLDGEYVIRAEIADVEGRRFVQYYRFVVQTAGPRVLMQDPVEGAILSTGQPTIRVSITANGAEIDPASIRILVDADSSAPLDLSSLVTFSFGSAQVTIPAESALGNGLHRVAAQAADVMGVVSTAFAAFTVQLPTGGGEGGSANPPPAPTLPPDLTLTLEVATQYPVEVGISLNLEIAPISLGVPGSLAVLVNGVDQTVRFLAAAVLTQAGERALYTLRKAETLAPDVSQALHVEARMQRVPEGADPAPEKSASLSLTVACDVVLGLQERFMRAWGLLYDFVAPNTVEDTRYILSGMAPKYAHAETAEPWTGEELFTDLPARAPEDLAGRNEDCRAIERKLEWLMREGRIVAAAERVGIWNHRNEDREHALGADITWEEARDHGWSECEATVVTGEAASTSETTGSMTEAPWTTTDTTRSTAWYPLPWGSDTRWAGTWSMATHHRTTWPNGEGIIGGSGYVIQGKTFGEVDLSGLGNMVDLKLKLSRVCDGIEKLPMGVATPLYFTPVEFTGGVHLTRLDDAAGEWWRGKWDMGAEEGLWETSEMSRGTGNEEGTRTGMVDYLSPEPLCADELELGRVGFQITPTSPKNLEAMQKHSESWPGPENNYQTLYEQGRLHAQLGFNQGTTVRFLVRPTNIFPVGPGWGYDHMIPWRPITVARLRQICESAGVGAGLELGPKNQVIGRAFQDVCLRSARSEGWFEKRLKENTGDINAPTRELKYGVPKAVRPDAIDWTNTWTVAQGELMRCENSLFVEVKAVHGTVTLARERGQMWGYIDAALASPAGMHDNPLAPRPAICIFSPKDTYVGAKLVAECRNKRIRLMQYWAMEPATDRIPARPVLILGEYRKHVMPDASQYQCSPYLAPHSEYLVDDPPPTPEAPADADPDAATLHETMRPEDEERKDE
ncbi:MAG: hypothetical protein HZA54_10645 [Planctomycetes bacterium]|nr:hypothetical protein [Planctomycetota bacterium]